MAALYPLKFTPRFVEKMWGGRKIESVLGKSLPVGKQIGESWELYDFPPGVVEKGNEWVSSIISNGPHAGRSLHWLVGEFDDELLGGVALAGRLGQFPLLIKFLDAREDLSVQVHPDQAYANAHPEAHLKTEAWYVMERTPGARLFKGLNAGTQRGHFQDAISNATVEQHLATVPAEPGDCHYLPSGTIHALGAGILVAEVQTPSDTTFRVHDFNRVDPSTGKTRTLHVDQAMACINFDEAAQTPVQSRRGETLDGNGAEPLVESPFFVMEKVNLPAGTRRRVSGSGPVVLIMLNGEAQIEVDNLDEPVRLKPGETVLLPAVMDHPVESAIRDSTWLRVTFPTRQ